MILISLSQEAVEYFTNGVLITKREMVWTSCNLNVGLELCTYGHAIKQCYMLVENALKVCEKYVMNL